MASLPLSAHALPLTSDLQSGLTWSPGTPRVGTVVTFTATASDGDAAVNYAQICWGDSTPCQTEASSPTLFEQGLACVVGDNWSRQWTHKYTSTGPRRVTLTVSSRGCPGLSDETKTIGYTITVTA